LEPNDVEFRVEILDDSVSWRPSIRRFKSPDGWVSAGVVPRWCPGGAHHADAVGFNGRVLADVAPDLWVVFNGVPIIGRSQRGGARGSNRRLEDRYLDLVSI
jgi:hypothetical protein